MIARLHAVAGQAQHVAHAHRRAAENVALNRDAVLVAAGDLHDRRVADARQQRADGDARHVAVRAAAVGGVDGVDIAVEHSCALVHILRIGRVRRRELGGDREAAGAQHALEAPRRSMPGQDRQRVARNRFVLESHGAAFGLPRFAGAGAGVGRRRGLGVPLAHHPQPRGAALQALVDRELHLAHRLDAARNALTASIGLDPHAAHLRLDLAIAVGAHAAARAVAQGLRAVHRARHAGRAEHALAAHAAVEQRALDGLLDGRHRPLDALIAERRGTARACASAMPRSRDRTRSSRARGAPTRA